MAKFNANEVASFISSQNYSLYDYQVRGKVATHFGVTMKTAAKWVERVTKAGLIKANGKVAVSLA